jgi:hypothetical protein
VLDGVKGSNDLILRQTFVENCHGLIEKGSLTISEAIVEKAKNLLKYNNKVYLAYEGVFIGQNSCLSYF